MRKKYFVVKHVLCRSSELCLHLCFSLRTERMCWAVAGPKAKKWSPLQPEIYFCLSKAGRGRMNHSGRRPAGKNEEKVKNASEGPHITKVMCICAGSLGLKSVKVPPVQMPSIKSLVPKMNNLMIFEKSRT